MNGKTILTVVLGLFVVGSLAYVMVPKGAKPEAPAAKTEAAPEVAPVGQSKPSSVNEVSKAVGKSDGPTVSKAPEQVSAKAETPKPKQPAPPVGPKQYVVTYFYMNPRCDTCRKIEATTEESVKEYFNDELAEKRLVWRTVSVDEPENKHFMKDFKLITKAVVVTELTGGKQTRWKDLDKIWEMIRDKETYKVYVRDEVRSFMSGT